MKNQIIVLLSFLALAGMNSCQSTNLQTQKPEIRNVILLIGDGMGLATVSAAIAASPQPLNLESMPVNGFSKTSSLTDYITDSAAGGTALSSGVRTKNGVLGQDTLGNKFRSILELAEDHGLSTGLVSTSAVTHATPASFIAHIRHRDLYEDIALEFLKTDIDVFIGGGINHFCHRKDGLNLLDSLKTRGYEVDTTLESILASKSQKLAGLNVPVHNTYRMDGRGDMLPKSAQKAIDILSKNEKGFFLMVEGSQIDWAGHANLAPQLVDETLDFDQAIGVALEFAKKDGHTIVIVTADHETGGVTLVGGNLEKHQSVVKFSTGDHTATMVPVYAYGPGSEVFSGIYKNTEVFEKMKKLFGF